MRTQLQICLCLVTVLLVTVLADEEPSNSVSSTDSPPIPSKTFQKLRKLLTKYNFEEQRDLKRVYLSNRSITCNDGSQAGFYLRKFHGSKRWIIFLEGGWYCYDKHSCQNRWTKHRKLMTSTGWPETREVGGLLSANPDENPFWWNANHVYVPYCTSDSWSGTMRRTRDDEYSFMGAEIVSQVVRDLVHLGLNTASSLLLAGSSAGGIGVMLNLDHVQNQVNHELGLKHISIRGVSDSGWFLDRAPYSPDGHSIYAVRKGMDLWKGRLPHACVAQHPQEPWRCYFGYRMYPTLSVPLFVFQWLFDEAQMTADNVGPPVTKQQWEYVHKMGDGLRQTFENVTAVFAPSCISHCVLTKKDWQLVKIDDVSLPQSLHCWEQSGIGNHRVNESNSQVETNQACARSIRKLLRSGPIKGNGTTVTNVKNGGKNGTGASFVDQNSASLDVKPEGKKAQRGQSEGKGNKKRRRRKHKGKRRERNKEGRGKKEKHARKKGGRKQGGKHNGNNHTAIMNNGTRPQRSVIPSNKRKCAQGCQFRLIERCTWPQCNHSCPKVHHPTTGEEVDFIELMKGMGLDIKSVAIALGMDIQILDTMDHDELLNLLTQHTN